MTIENFPDQESGPSIEIIFEHLVEDEIKRVKYLCSKYEWYKENKYKPIYPKSIKEKLDKEENVTEEDIETAVSEEFDTTSAEKHISEIKEEWDKIKDNFFDNLKTLELPLQEKYFVSITKYGTGGSYITPNRIQINLAQVTMPSLTIAHETVHLTIEHLIKKYNIEHWTKERIVDLIMSRFFPDQKRLQRNPTASDKINEIFEQEFPNIENVLSRISEFKDPEKSI